MHSKCYWKSGYTPPPNNGCFFISDIVLSMNAKQSKFIIAVVLSVSFTSPLQAVEVFGMAPPEDIYGKPENDIKRRIAECYAYQIRTDGKVNPATKAKLKKIAKDNGFKNPSCRDAVISKMEWLDSITDVKLLNSELSKWKKSCEWLDIYGDL